MLKLTEHTVRNMSTPTLLDFQQWLDIQAKVLETLEPACDRSTATNVLPAPPHQRHRKSNPLLAQSVLLRTLSTNAPCTRPLP